MQLIALLLALLVCTSLTYTSSAEVWTNRLGRAFCAKVLRVSDAGVTFLFEEDKGTNTLEFSKLHSSSFRRICKEYNFAPIPPRMVATYNRAAADLKRLSEQYEDGLLKKDDALKRRSVCIRVFGEICSEKGVDAEIVLLLKNRLNNLFPLPEKTP